MRRTYCASTALRNKDAEHEIAAFCGHAEEAALGRPTPPTACAAPCSSTAREAAALVGADIEAQEVEEAEELDADSVLRTNFDGEGSDAA